MLPQQFLIAALFMSSAMLTAAADFSFVAGATAFLGWKYFLGVDNAKAAYSSCVEHYSDGSVKTTGADCVFDIMTYFCGSAFSILGGGIFGVSYVTNGVDGALETHKAGSPPEPKMRRDTTYDQHILDTFNHHLNLIQPESYLRADAIVHSDVHPHDGLAFKMNVHADSSTLHMHTNGTHAMGMFHDDDDNEANLARRGPLPTQGHYFHFDGISGMKMEWHNINHDPDGAKDFSTIMNRFVISNLMPNHIMETANAWDFQACNKAKTATFAYGRFWFKNEGIHLKYEAISPRGCNS